MRCLLILVMLLQAGLAAGGSTQGSSDDIHFEAPKSIALSTDGSSKWVFGQPQALSGALSLPAGPGPFALVVLAHGCDGITPVETGWANVLNSWGYATFLLDSLDGRNLESLCADARLLRPIQRVPDAYGALAVLAKHPKISASRIALMGFSHGGALALTAATAWAQRQFAPAGHPAFRAFVSFYPANCNVEYPELTKLSAPVRIHVGAIDDWTPAAPCVRLVNQWKRLKQDADITLYPDAHHAFDYAGLGQMHLPDVDNGAGCTVKLASALGPLTPPVEGMGCVTKGATIAGNQEALDKAEKLVRSQLSALMK